MHNLCSLPSLFDEARKRPPFFSSQCSPSCGTDRMAPRGNCSLRPFSALSLTLEMTTEKWRALSLLSNTLGSAGSRFYTKVSDM